MPPGGGGTVFSKVDEFESIEASSGIAAGADGNVWFSINTRVTTRESGGVARITPAGAVTLFRIPAPAGEEVAVNAIAFASDGRLYAATTNGIGVFTPQSGWSFLPERPQCGGFPNDLAAGADGVVWYVVNGTCFELGRIKPDGDVEPIHTDLASFPIQVAVGNDGEVWATERAGSIARFDPRSGNFEEVRLPASAQPEPWGISASPGRSSDVWVTDLAGAVWRVRPANHSLRRLGRRDGLRSDARPRTIAPGPQQALWFGISEPAPPAIGRLIPPRCKVPHLRGTTLARAERRLRAAHCRLGRVRGRGRRVRSQAPRPGAIRPERARVSVRLGQ
jgi:streptogramin lyase